MQEKQSFPVVVVFGQGSLLTITIEHNQMRQNRTEKYDRSLSIGSCLIFSVGNFDKFFLDRKPTTAF
jgi:hypothetical protein